MLNLFIFISVFLQNKEQKQGLRLKMLLVSEGGGVTTFSSSMIIDVEKDMLKYFFKILNLYLK
jgi:hypothetical protein